MATSPPKIIRQVKTLAEQADELARKEEILRVEIMEKQAQLESLSLLRCAIADEQRRGFGAAAKAKKTQVDWKLVLALKGRARKSHKRAQDKALKDAHLLKGWVSWRDMDQVLVAFELSKGNPAELFWVRDALNDVLPHIRPIVPGYKVIGISHAGAFSLKYFLMCSEDNTSFRIIQTYLPRPDITVFEGPSLHSALEYIQHNLARP